MGFWDGVTHHLAGKKQPILNGIQGTDSIWHNVTAQCLKISLVVTWENIPMEGTLLLIQAFEGYGGNYIQRKWSWPVITKLYWWSISKASHRKGKMGKQKSPVWELALSSQDYGVSKEQHKTDSTSHDSVLPLSSGILLKSAFFPSTREESGVTGNI